MTKTQSKLEEAEFFLNKLIDSKRDFKNFSHYLHAFLSSARSVSWVMKAEYGHNKGWQEWWENKKAKDEEAVLMKLFTDLRNSSIKRGKVAVGASIEFNARNMSSKAVALLKLFKKNRTKVQVTIDFPEENDPPGTKPELTFKGQGKESMKLGSVKIVDVDPIFLLGEDRKFKSKKVIDLCMKYFSFLQELVNEWELKQTSS